MSNTEASYQPPQQIAVPPQKQGMSGCAKAAIVCTILGVVCVGCCCIGGSFYIFSSFTDDPAKVRAAADEILTWDGNEKFAPLGAFDVWVARGVMLGDESSSFVFLVDSRFGEDMGRGMDTQIQAQLGEDLEKTDVIERGEIEVTIRGEQVEFEFNQSRGERSDKLYWEVTGMVDGNKYPAFILIRVLQDEYSEDDMVDLLESIR